MRTQDEIVARIEQQAKGDDFFGFAREVLIEALDYEHAKPYLKPDTTADQWTPADVEGEAKGYLDFAIGKILNHRGISASRSVDKLREYAWLLGRDDVVSSMDAADYENYGAPKVKAFADGMGYGWPSEAYGDTGLTPDDIRALARMADGLPCSDFCEEGCGS